ncbi:MAG: hypothetical protein EBR15_08565, partial [Gammaproteobacteria bacterium]|nr:hypothetical protein [Gammaproteobacteria bacterium]
AALLVAGVPTWQPVAAHDHVRRWSCSAGEICDLLTELVDRPEGLAALTDRLSSPIMQSEALKLPEDATPAECLDALREQAYALAVRFAKAGTQAEQPAGD